MTRQLGTPPDLQEAASRMAILDILNTHCRGLDRCEADWIKSTYWHDAVVDYGSFKGQAHAFADIVVPVLRRQYEMTQHVLGNTLFDIQGHLAKTESYLTAHHLLLGGREDLFYSGRYLDVLECRDGIWKLRSRRVVMDWSRRLEVEDERSTGSFADLAKGANDRTDPIHEFWPKSD
ncbi:MAG: nuclear transport factor 2 family protein [Proteobacteria bacterium]|nr:nuclear transport factor 2 family protein [Pseudomonadota bacterium]